MIIYFRLIHLIPDWLKMPELDNLKSVQRLTMLAMNAAMCCHGVRAELVKTQADRDLVEEEIRLVKQLFEYLKRLYLKYQHEIPQNPVLTEFEDFRSGYP